MESLTWVAGALLMVDVFIGIGLSLRVIMRRLSVGASLAWLTIILLFPCFGALLYLLFGELRLGRRRAAWAARIHGPYEAWLGRLRTRSQIDWTALAPEGEPLSLLTQTKIGIPPLPDNQLELIDDADTVLQRLTADIDRSRRTCHLEFYIWNVGGRADDVVDALLRAQQRGVTCRVLLDAVGSAHFLKSNLAQRLRDHGVALQAALPVNMVRMLFARLDLRLHRKIVVLDDQLAYTGSLNLVDPRFFKQTAGVGQWIDAMVRVQGSAVEPLAITFLEDWQLETEESMTDSRRSVDVLPVTSSGRSVVQVIPSGPLVRGEAIQEILLMAIYSARKELILTTPYLVPDERLLTALTSAAHRGVAVTIVVPEKVDSLLVRFASQAHKDELLAAGVRIALFHGGLLHTKSITIDGQISLFGSLNLDPRSLSLNFEITLAIYDPQFTAVLVQLQRRYLEQSVFIELGTWRSRSARAKLTENVARLLSPLL